MTDQRAVKASDDTIEVQRMADQMREALGIADDNDIHADEPGSEEVQDETAP
jgi:hypothetical protein